MTLEEMVEEYRKAKDSLSDEEMARREHDIWEKVLEGHKGKLWDKHARELKLNELLGEPCAATHRRATLFNGGAVVRPIWDRINSKQLTVTTGLSLMQDAKHHAVDSDIPMEEAVQYALNVYDSRPYVRFSGGIPTRMGMPRARGAPPKKKRKAIRGRPKEGRSAESLLVGKIRSGIDAYLDDRTKGIDPALKEQLLQETGVEIRILLNGLDSKLRRLVGMFEASERADLAVTRRDVVGACHTLHMDPPREGRPADLVAASKQKRRLARLYHPDAHGGEEKAAMRQKFDEIMAAFARLEQYNLKLEKPTGKENGNNGDRSEGGGSGA